MKKEIYADLHIHIGRTKKDVRKITGKKFNAYKYLETPLHEKLDLIDYRLPPRSNGKLTTYL